MNANIRTARCDRRLNRVADDGDFADPTVWSRRFKPDIGRRFFRARQVVVFNVVTGDVQVVDVSIERLDPRTFVVTDVIRRDDRLVQVAVVEEDAVLAVVVDV